MFYVKATHNTESVKMICGTLTLRNAGGLTIVHNTLLWTHYQRSSPPKHSILLPQEDNSKSSPPL
jgi:hypothetical protein